MSFINGSSDNQPLQAVPKSKRGGSRAGSGRHTAVQAAKRKEEQIKRAEREAAKKEANKRRLLGYWGLEPRDAPVSEQQTENDTSASSLSTPVPPLPVNSTAIDTTNSDWMEPQLPSWNALPIATLLDGNGLPSRESVTSWLGQFVEAPFVIQKESLERVFQLFHPAVSHVRSNGECYFDSLSVFAHLGLIKHPFPELRTPFEFATKVRSEYDQLYDDANFGDDEKTHQELSRIAFEDMDAQDQATYITRCEAHLGRELTISNATKANGLILLSIPSFQRRRP